MARLPLPAAAPPAPLRVQSLGSSHTGHVGRTRSRRGLKATENSARPGTSEPCIAPLDGGLYSLGGGYLLSGRTWEEIHWAVLRDRFSDILGRGVGGWSANGSRPEHRGIAHGVRRKSRQLSTIYSVAPPVSTPGGLFPRPWTSSPPGVMPLQLKCLPSLSAVPSLPTLRDSPPLRTTALLPHPLLPLSLFACVWRFLYLLLSLINYTVRHVFLGSFFWFIFPFHLFFI